ncbi:hypothetical protein [Rhizobium sp. R693]|uniref:hypothetical protein n=1 Tax=Rhizobium sp. R693 TaxID=1764276 RepID=UPI00167C31AF|nr:hypothetical protein [Rhizobium sp. R693]
MREALAGLGDPSKGEIGRLGMDRNSQGMKPSWDDQRGRHSLVIEHERHAYRVDEAAVDANTPFQAALDYKAGAPHGADY